MGFALRLFGKYALTVLVIYCGATYLFFRELTVARTQEELTIEKTSLEERLFSMQAQTNELLATVQQLEVNKSREVSALLEILAKLQRPDAVGRQEKAQEKQVFRQGPSKHFESTRRKIETELEDIWYFLQTKLKPPANSKEQRTNLTSLLQIASGYYRSMKYQLQELKESDNMEAWRLKKSSELGDLVQRRLHNLQNPSNCIESKKLHCNAKKSCGFGCQIHHMVYCLILSYATQRTLILQNFDKFSVVLKPISFTCTSSSKHRSAWKSLSKEAKQKMDKIPEIDLPVVDTMISVRRGDRRGDNELLTKYLPPAIPEDLSDDIVHFHGDPRVWWIGQFAKYLFRLQPAIQTELNNFENSFMKRPIVGVHVRRTDKLFREAKRYDIDEYMKYVDEWYDMLERKQAIDKRRVFLATDERSVLTDAKNRYPADRYEFIYDSAIVSSASVGARNTDDGIKGIVHDIYLLSITDFLVCTFSSQVCRLAYELMQTRHGDASAKFKSLDDLFYYGGQGQFFVRAIQTHQPTGQEIELRVGDIIEFQGNLKNGISTGVNTRTGKRGEFPSYKVEAASHSIKMPLYPEVKRPLQ